jgi:predicted RNA-binding protein YlxR (DUF448 family)
VTSPVRTCIGCRERELKGDLMRLVWRDGVVVDERQTAPGRGAYLHRRSKCLETAIKRRSLGRALRVQNQYVDPATLREAAAPHLGGA